MTITMTKKQPIGIFATPENEEALQKYIDLFNTDEDKNAAVIGYVYYEAITQSTWSEFQSFEIPNESRIVAITVAAMTWNLKCKQETELQENADGTE